MADNPREHLIELLEDFRVGMLTTRTPQGELHVRPMNLAAVENDADLVFAAGLDSPKIAEIENEPRVAVTLQGKLKWVALYGTARVSRDRARIHAVWRDSWKLWFPNGKDDPNLCLIHVDVTAGEYWDDSGVRGVRFALEALKAVLRGTTPDTGVAKQHAKIAI